MSSEPPSGTRVGCDMPSPNEYFYYAQQCARLASDDKYQEYREVLIQMAAHLMRLGWLEARHSASAIGQEETSGVLLIERAPDPETDDAVPIAGCSTATISRADLVRKAGPGAASEAMAAAIASHPGRSVGRCAPVILV
jgi:hypothetical protein